jgi:hypothetical protein
MMRSTSSPAIRPASFVAWRWDGDHGLLDILSKVRLGIPLEFLQDESRDLLRRIGFSGLRDEDACIPGWAGCNLKGNHLAFGFNFFIMAADKALDRVWRLATWPTRTSPFFPKATTDGQIGPPSAVGITTGSPP